MPRKKKADTVPAAPKQKARGRPDVTFSALASLHVKKFGTDDIFIGTTNEAARIAIPLRTFAQRYTFQNQGIPLGAVINYVGPEQSFKSGMAFETIRWHVDIEGGGGLYLRTERDQPELRAAIIGEENLGTDDALRVVPQYCRSIDAVQMALQSWTDAQAKAFPTLGACPFPACLVIDAIASVSTVAVGDKIMKKGVKPDFGDEAKNWTKWLKVWPHEMTHWPLTWVIVNHEKVRPAPGGFGISYHRPAGKAFDFGATFQFRMRMSEKWESKMRSGRTITLRALKIYGHSVDYTVEVDVFWREGEVPQRAIFDWPRTSILLLSGGLPPGKANAARQVVDITVDDKGYVRSKKLGFDKETMSAAGQILESDRKLCDELDAAVGIMPKTPFEPNVPFLLQQLRSLGREHLYDSLCKKSSQKQLAAVEGDVEGGE